MGVFKYTNAWVNLMCKYMDQPSQEALYQAIPKNIPQRGDGHSFVLLASLNNWSRHSWRSVK